MGITVVVAEKSSTVLKMVETAISGLGMDIYTADHGEAALQAVRDNVPALLIIRDDLPGEDGYAVAQSMAADPGLAHIPVVLLLGRTATADMSRMGEREFAGHINLPFKTQALVETVCQALNREAPDVALYRPYMLEIPLAHPEAVIQSEESPRFEPDQPSIEGARAAAVLTAADPEMLIATTSRAETLDIEPTTSSVDSSQENDFEQLEDTFGEASTRQDISLTDAYASTEVFTLERSPLETMDLSINEVDLVSNEETPLEDEPKEAPPSTDDDEVITNVVPPVAPVVALPDVDDLVARVTEAIGEGPALRGALADVSRDIIEQVAWEVVPALAEAILKEEVARLLRDGRTTPS